MLHRLKCHLDAQVRLKRIYLTLKCLQRSECFCGTWPGYEPCVANGRVESASCAGVKRYGLLRQCFGAVEGFDKVVDV